MLLTYDMTRKRRITPDTVVVPRVALQVNKPVYDNFSQYGRPEHTVNEIMIRLLKHAEITGLTKLSPITNPTQSQKLEFDDDDDLELEVLTAK